MKKLFYFFIIIFFSIPGHSQNRSIYSFKVDTVTHTRQIAFSNFNGKKILIANASILDTNNIQWKELLYLQKRFANKLVIVIFPTMDVNEKSAASFFQQNKFPFVIASNVDIGNNSVNHMYDWLQARSQNSLKDSYSRGPYQKYLINEKGKLIAVFGPQIRPMSKATLAAIEKSY
jgi:glutathione peroxidase